MGMAGDAELLAVEAGISTKKRFPYVCGAALATLCLTDRLAMGDGKVRMRRPDSVGDEAADVLLDAIGRKRRSLSADKCLEIAWKDVMDAVAGVKGDVQQVRRRVDRAISNWDAPPERRVFAALTVSAGFVRHPDPNLRGRRARGPEAAMLVIGPQEPPAGLLLKADVAAVGKRMEGVVQTGGSPFDIIRTMRTERLRGGEAAAKPVQFGKEPTPSPRELLRALRRGRDAGPADPED